MRTPQVPPLADPRAQSYLETLTTFVGKELDKRTPDNQVRRELYLQSSDGGVWQITVSDLGALTTTKVAQV